MRRSALAFGDYFVRSQIHFLDDDSPARSETCSRKTPFGDVQQVRLKPALHASAAATANHAPLVRATLRLFRANNRRVLQHPRSAKHEFLARWQSAVAQGGFREASFASWPSVP